MKLCNTCETEKPRDQFGNRAASKDGLAAKCKSCQRVYDNARSTDPERKEVRRTYAKSERGRVAGGEAKSKYRKRNPNKYKAHNRVNNAVRDGKLLRESCSECGSDKDVHAHHDDYSQQLDVRWLCCMCHKLWHNVNGEALNP